MDTVAPLNKRHILFKSICIALVIALLWNDVSFAADEMLRLAPNGAKRSALAIPNRFTPPCTIIREGDYIRAIDTSGDFHMLERVPELFMLYLVAQALPEGLTKHQAISLIEQTIPNADSIPDFKWRELENGQGETKEFVLLYKDKKWVFSEKEPNSREECITKLECKDIDGKKKWVYVREMSDKKDKYGLKGLSRAEAAEKLFAQGIKGEEAGIAMIEAGLIDRRAYDRGLLSAQAIAYSQIICDIVNPEHKPLVGLYGGAGADASRFFLSTDADIGVFISYVQDFEVVVEQSTEFYKAEKRRLGYGKNVFLHESIWPYLKCELEVMGAIDIEDPKQDKKDSFIWHITFTWNGRKKQIFYLLDNITSRESLQNKLETIGFAETKFDVYYQCAAEWLTKDYEKYMGPIIDRLKPNAWVVTNDFDRDKQATPLLTADSPFNDILTRRFPDVLRAGKWNMENYGREMSLYQVREPGQHPYSATTTTPAGSVKGVKTPSGAKPPTDTNRKDGDIIDDIRAINEFFGAHDFDDDGIPVRVTRRDHLFGLSTTRDIIDISELYLKDTGKRVLCMGSGTAKDVSLFSKFAEHVTGIEIDEDLDTQAGDNISTLSDRGLINRDKITLEKGDFLDTDFDLSGYDLIYVYWPYRLKDSKRYHGLLEQKLSGPKGLKPGAIFVIKGCPEAFIEFKGLEILDAPKDRDLSEDITGYEFKGYDKRDQATAERNPRYQTALSAGGLIWWPIGLPLLYLHACKIKEQILSDLTSLVNRNRWYSAIAGRLAGFFDWFLLDLSKWPRYKTQPHPRGAIGGSDIVKLNIFRKIAQAPDRHAIPLLIEGLAIKPPGITRLDLDDDKNYPADNISKIASIRWEINDLVRRAFIQLGKEEPDCFRQLLSTFYDGSKPRWQRGQVLLILSDIALSSGNRELLDRALMLISGLITEEAYNDFEISQERIEDIFFRLTAAVENISKPSRKPSQDEKKALEAVKEYVNTVVQKYIEQNKQNEGKALKAIKTLNIILSKTEVGVDEEVVYIGESGAFAIPKSFFYPSGDVCGLSLNLLSGMLNSINLLAFSESERAIAGDIDLLLRAVKRDIIRIGRNKPRLSQDNDDIIYALVANLFREDGRLWWLNWIPRILLRNGILTHEQAHLQSAEFNRLKVKEADLLRGRVTLDKDSEKRAPPTFYLSGIIRNVEKTIVTTLLIISAMAPFLLIGYHFDLELLFYTFLVISLSLLWWFPIANLLTALVEGIGYFFGKGDVWEAASRDKPKNELYLPDVTKKESRGLVNLSSLFENIAKVEPITTHKRQSIDYYNIDVEEELFIVCREKGMIAAKGLITCVVVTLYDPKTKIGAVLHCTNGTDIREAFTRVLERIEFKRCDIGGLQARVIGGLDGRSEETVFAIYKTLDKYEIPIIEKDVLGWAKRSVALGLSTGELYDLQKDARQIPAELKHSGLIALPQLPQPARSRGEKLLSASNDLGPKKIEPKPTFFERHRKTKAIVLALFTIGIVILAANLLYGPYMVFRSSYLPLSTVTASFVANFIADYLRQKVKVTLGKQEKIDWKHIIRWALTFSLISGTFVSYLWHDLCLMGNILQRIAKIFIDMALLNAIYFTPLVLTTGSFFVEKRTFNVSVKYAMEKWFFTYITSLFYWIPALFLAYFVFTPQAPVLGLFVEQIIWAAILSYIVHEDEKDKGKKEDDRFEKNYRIYKICRWICGAGLAASFVIITNAIGFSLPFTLVYGMAVAWSVLFSRNINKIKDGEKKEPSEHTIISTKDAGIPHQPVGTPPPGSVVPEDAIRMAKEAYLYNKFAAKNTTMKDRIAILRQLLSTKGGELLVSHGLREANLRLQSAIERIFGRLAGCYLTGLFYKKHAPEDKFGRAALEHGISDMILELKRLFGRWEERESLIENLTSPIASRRLQAQNHISREWEVSSILRKLIEDYDIESDPQGKKMKLDQALKLMTAEGEKRDLPSLGELVELAGRKTEPSEINSVLDGALRIIEDSEKRRKSYYFGILREEIEKTSDIFRKRYLLQAMVSIDTGETLKYARRLCLSDNRELAIEFILQLTDVESARGIFKDDLSIVLKEFSSPEFSRIIEAIRTLYTPLEVCRVLLDAIDKYAGELVPVRALFLAREVRRTLEPLSPEDIYEVIYVNLTQKEKERFINALAQEVSERNFDALVCIHEREEFPAIRIRCISIFRRFLNVGPKEVKARASGIASSVLMDFYFDDLGLAETAAGFISDYLTSEIKEKLIATIKEGHPEQQKRAIAVLWRHPDSQVINTLVDALNNRNIYSDARTALANVLELHPEFRGQAVDRIESALSEERALSLLQDIEGEKFVDRLLYAWEKGEVDGVYVIDALLETTNPYVKNRAVSKARSIFNSRNNKPEERANALLLLYTFLEETEGVELLLKVLENPGEDGQNKEYAVKALGLPLSEGRYTGEIIESYRKLYGSTNSRLIKNGIIQACYNIGKTHPKAIELLQEIADGSDFFAASAREALSLIRNSGLEESRVDRKRKPSRGRKPRYGSLEAIGLALGFKKYDPNIKIDGVPIDKVPFYKWKKRKYYSPFLHAPIFEESFKVGIPFIVRAVLKTLYPKTPILYDGVFIGLLIILAIIFMILHDYNKEPSEEDIKLESPKEEVAELIKYLIFGFSAAFAAASAGLLFSLTSVYAINFFKGLLVFFIMRKVFLHFLYKKMSTLPKEDQEALEEIPRIMRWLAILLRCMSTREIGIQTIFTLLSASISIPILFLLPIPAFVIIPLALLTSMRAHYRTNRIVEWGRSLFPELRYASWDGERDKDDSKKSIIDMYGKDKNIEMCYHLDQISLAGEGRSDLPKDTIEYLKMVSDDEIRHLIEISNLAMERKDYNTICRIIRAWTIIWPNVFNTRRQEYIEYFVKQKAAIFSYLAEKMESAIRHDDYDTVCEILQALIDASDFSRKLAEVVLDIPRNIHLIPHRYKKRILDLVAELEPECREILGQEIHKKIADEKRPGDLNGKTPVRFNKRKQLSFSLTKLLVAITVIIFILLFTGNLFAAPGGDVLAGEAAGTAGQSAAEFNIPIKFIFIGYVLLSIFFIVFKRHIQYRQLLNELSFRIRDCEAKLELLKKDQVLTKDEIDRYKVVIAEIDNKVKKIQQKYITRLTAKALRDLNNFRVRMQELQEELTKQVKAHKLLDPPGAVQWAPGKGPILRWHTDEELALRLDGSTDKRDGFGFHFLPFVIAIIATAIGSLIFGKSPLLSIILGGVALGMIVSSNVTEEPPSAETDFEDEGRQVLNQVADEMLDVVRTGDYLKPGDTLYFKIETKNKDVYEVGKLAYPKNRRKWPYIKIRKLTQDNLGGYDIEFEKKYPVRFRNESTGKSIPRGKPVSLKDVLIGVKDGDGKIKWLTPDEFFTKERVGISFTELSEFAKKRNCSPYDLECSGCVYRTGKEYKIKRSSESILYFDEDGRYCSPAGYQDIPRSAEIRGYFHVHSRGRENSAFISLGDIEGMRDYKTKIEIILDEYGRGRIYKVKEGADLNRLIELYKKDPIYGKPRTYAELMMITDKYAGDFYDVYYVDISGGRGNVVVRKIELPPTAHAPALMETEKAIKEAGRKKDGTTIEPSSGRGKKKPDLVTQKDIKKALDEMTEIWREFNRDKILIDNWPQQIIIQKVLSMRLVKGKSFLVVGPGGVDLFTILIAKLGLNVCTIDLDREVAFSTQRRLSALYNLENVVEDFYSYDDLKNRRFDYIAAFGVFLDSYDIEIDDMEPALKCLNPDGGYIFVNRIGNTTDIEGASKKFEKRNNIKFLLQRQIDISDFSMFPEHFHEIRKGVAYKAERTKVLKKGKTRSGIAAAGAGTAYSIWMGLAMIGILFLYEILRQIYYESKYYQARINKHPKDKSIINIILDCTFETSYLPFASEFIRRNIALPILNTIYNLGGLFEEKQSDISDAGALRGSGRYQTMRESPILGHSGLLGLSSHSPSEFSFGQIRTAPIKDSIMVTMKAIFQEIFALRKASEINKAITKAWNKFISAFAIKRLRLTVQNILSISIMRVSYLLRHVKNSSFYNSIKYNIALLILKLIHNLNELFKGLTPELVPAGVPIKALEETPLEDTTVVLTEDKEVGASSDSSKAPHRTDKPDHKFIEKDGIVILRCRYAKQKIGPQKGIEVIPEYKLNRPVGIKIREITFDDDEIAGEVDVASETAVDIDLYQDKEYLRGTAIERWGFYFEFKDNLPAFVRPYEDLIKQLVVKAYEPLLNVTYRERPRTLDEIRNRAIGMQRTGPNSPQEPSQNLQLHWEKHITRDNTLINIRKSIFYDINQYILRKIEELNYYTGRFDEQRINELLRQSVTTGELYIEPQGGSLRFTIEMPIEFERGLWTYSMRLLKLSVACKRFGWTQKGDLYLIDSAEELVVREFTANDILKLPEQEAVIVVNDSTDLDFKSRILKELAQMGDIRAASIFIEALPTPTSGRFEGISAEDVASIDIDTVEIAKEGLRRIGPHPRCISLLKEVIGNPYLAEFKRLHAVEVLTDIAVASGNLQVLRDIDNFMDKVLKGQTVDLGRQIPDSGMVRNAAIKAKNRISVEFRRLEKQLYFETKRPDYTVSETTKPFPVWSDYFRGTEYAMHGNLDEFIKGPINPILDNEFKDLEKLCRESEDKEGQSLVLFSDDILKNVIFYDFEKTLGRIKNRLKNGEIVLYTRDKADSNNVVALRKIITNVVGNETRVEIISIDEYSDKDYEREILKDNPIREIEWLVKRRAKQRGLKLNDILAIIRGNGIAEYTGLWSSYTLEVPLVIINDSIAGGNVGMFSFAEAIAKALGAVKRGNSWIEILHPIGAISQKMYEEYIRYRDEILTQA